MTAFWSTSFESDTAGMCTRPDDGSKGTLGTEESHGCSTPYLHRRPEGILRSSAAVPTAQRLDGAGDAPREASFAQDGEEFSSALLQCRDLSL